MSCSHDSKLLEYWPVISKMWKNYNFNPILGISNNFTNEQCIYLSNFGKVYFFPKISNLKNETQGKLIKYFICNELNNEDIAVFMDLNIFLLNNEWLSELIASLDDKDSNLIFTWPEFKSDYLMGKVKYFKKLFNLNNSQYVKWLENLIVNQTENEDKEGNILNEDFSEKSFLFNFIVKQDGLVKIKLMPRNDIFFINNESYVMEKRTDWCHWEKLEIDSDYDVIGGYNFFDNLKKYQNLLEVLNLYKLSEVEKKNFILILR